MAEYIEREALLSHQYNKSWSRDPQFAEMVVDVENIYDAPAADVVEVVRCGQCRNLYKIINSFNGHVSYRCSNPYGLQGHVLPHFYCVHGFKGEEEQPEPPKEAEKNHHLYSNVAPKPGGPFSLYCESCKCWVPNTANAEMRKEGLYAHSHWCKDGLCDMRNGEIKEATP
jgi:hypothetical protein